MMDWAAILRVSLDLLKAEREGPGGLHRRQEKRLASLVAHARVYSRYYREAYSGLGHGQVSILDLPVTHKSELMERFDDWLTDPHVTRDDVEAFVADPTLNGTWFRDEYYVCRSSGTTGRPGLFVADRGSIAVTFAVYAIGAIPGLRRANWPRMITKRARKVRVVGTAGHFAGAGVTLLAQQENPRRAKRETVIGVEQPLDDIVKQLNAFDPAVLQTYPSALRLLTRERLAGRLAIEPGLIGVGGETVSPEERRQMSAAFGAPVLDGYASSECLLLAMTCPQDWLHYRSDWMILEPVDADHRPVPAGQPSESVLLTNLSNRVQPVIRYDIGDSVLLRPDPCECGSPLPAMRVVGRSDDVLRFESDGTVVDVLPLAITAALEEIAGLERVQLVQQSPTALEARLAYEAASRPDEVQDATLRLLRSFLDRHGLENVSLRVHELPSDPLGASGKFRQVIGTSRVPEAVRH